MRLDPWLLAALWTVPAVLSTLETVMFARLSGHPIAVWRAFVAEAPQWYGWALLTPLVFALAARFPIRRPLKSVNVLVHLAASLGAGLLIALVEAVVNVWVRPAANGMLSLTRNWFVGNLPGTTIAYVAIVGAGVALDSAARLRERERREAQLEMQLRDAQLGALRMQLQPHFLFNSLNAVMALVRDHETQRAVHALSLLSDILRTTVGAGDAQETTLDEELGFVGRYLEIERVRFGERLRVLVDVPDELRDLLVPTFVLQPFVENALKHGVLRERGSNEIAIVARAEAGTLHLTVRDDGRGLPREGTGGGVGIPNARARLQRMYAAASVLTVRDADRGTGVVVDIALPLRRSATPDSPPARPLAGALS